MMRLEMSWAKRLLMRLRKRLRAALAAVEAAAGVLDAVETAAIPPAAIPPAAIEAMRSERLNRQSVNIKPAAPVEAGEADPTVSAASTALNRRRSADVCGH
jgi:hypothetical protein